VLLDYFGDDVDGFEQCCRCDNCLNPPQVADAGIGDDQFDRQDAPADAGPQFEPGERVRVPRFDEGTVVSMAGDQVTIEFPGQERRIFLADFVTRA
jgi:ATP-dependent DNA helicase RecQ